MSNKPGWLTIAKSVIASLFGVQSHKNYQRDFSQGNLVSYIVMGVVFVTLFVLSLILLVNWILQL